MKTAIIPVANKPRRYPFIGKLKSNPEMVVLFINENEGVTLTDSRDWKQGTYQSDWDVKLFEPINGKIVLENEDYN